MGRRIVLIVAGILLLAMLAVPPWRAGWASTGWVVFAPVFSRPGPKWSAFKFSDPDIRLPEYHLAWDLLAGEVAALAVVVFFALRCLPRKER